MAFFKDLKKSLMEATGKIGESAIGPTELALLDKFAAQVSSAFQPELPKVIDMIEKELNRYGYTLGDVDTDTPFDDSGSEDFAILQYATGESVENAYIELSWEQVSGKQFDYREDGAKLRYDVTLKIERENPFLDLDTDMIGESIKHDDYEIESSDWNHKHGESGDIEHTEASEERMNALGIEKVNKPGTYGPAKTITVRHPKTKGDSKFSVYQSDVSKDGNPVLSVRGVYARNNKDDSEYKTHKEALLKHLQGYKSLSEATNDQDKQAYENELKNLSDKELKDRLKQHRNTDEHKFNAVVSEFEARGLKEGKEYDVDYAVQIAETGNRSRLAHHLFSVDDDTLMAIRDRLSENPKHAKLFKQATVGMNLKEEQLDEISKQALGNYIQKASQDAANKAVHSAELSADGGRDLDKAETDKSALGSALKKYKAADVQSEKSYKRLMGISKATKKLVGEETEQLDESMLVKKINGKTLTLKTDESVTTLKLSGDGSLLLTVEDTGAGETASATVSKAKAEDFLSAIMEFYLSKSPDKN